MIYKDQFTPWKPDCLVFDVGVPLNADILMGHAIGLSKANEGGKSEVMVTLMTSALTANYEIIKMQLEGL